MASPDLTSGQVMNASAALLNDVARTIYTYSVQVPYLNIALRELQESFELNNVPVTDQKSVVIPIDDGDTSISFSGTPALPSDLIEPSVLWQRLSGQDPYYRVDRVDTLDQALVGVELNFILNYVWQAQEIRFLPCNNDLDVKIDYIRSIFPTITDETSQLNIVNGMSFLEYRNAALCAEFIGENKTRADELNTFAVLALDRVVGIGTKGRQSFNTRHRPFRAGYKRNGWN